MSNATIKFYYNGFKVNGGKLYKAHYGAGTYTNFPEGTITIYASSNNYTHMPKEMRDFFNIENNTEIQSDYFENDRIRVLPTHPLYAEVKAAHEAAAAKLMKRLGK